MVDNNHTNSSSYCHIFPEDPHKCDVIITLRRTLAAFSVIGSLFMIFIIWLFKKYKAFAQRLILFLSISAFFDAIVYLMGGLRPDGPVCDFQGWWITYFDWTVLLWVCFITLNLFFSVVYSKTTERYERWFHAVAWVFPLIMSLIPFSGDHYGPAGAWCWIKENVAWRMGIWYAPLFIILGILVATYTYITVKMRRQTQAYDGSFDPDSERKKQLLKDDIKPLRIYPFIYLALSVFPLINRIQNAAEPDNAVYGLLILAVISSSLTGAINAIVFGLDTETMKRLKPNQIKLALQNRFTPRSVIREYPQPAAGHERLDNSPEESQSDINPAC